MNYNIIEVANTHGGDINYMNRLIDEFSIYNSNIGIKFQPFSYNTIATPDYSWYEIYKQLFFNEEQWVEIIDKAAVTKDVWLDLFDIYGVKILKNNLDKIKGIKFQVSVLFNDTLFDELAELNLTDKLLIINVSSLSLEEINFFISKIEKTLKPQEILLEIGFQAYPTSLDDTGLNKLQLIKKKFNRKIVFADHLDGNSEDALWLPVIATMMGANVIEKHVMLNPEDTKYDHFSSLTPARYKIYYDKFVQYTHSLNQPFINEREKEYLQKSIMAPILKHGKSAGSIINLKKDFEYKRSNHQGLNSREISNLQENFHILQNNKAEGQTIKAEDFKKANIATIIACRLKSSRLKKKALLKIGDLSSVEYCIKNALKFKNTNFTILATSIDAEDAELENYTYAPSVIFHKGDPDDVIQRYLDICRKLKIDIVVRVTADMPFIDDEILQILLKAHFESGADYTTARDTAIGVNLEIMNVNALEKIKMHLPSAAYSEYMTWYFQNNSEYFNLNFVDLPERYIRNYRLTLDYQEDLELFNNIHKNFTEKGKFEYNLSDIFQYLDDNPGVAEINSHLSLKYKTDQELINTLNKVTKIIA